MKEGRKEGPSAPFKAQMSRCPDVVAMSTGACPCGASVYTGTRISQVATRTEGIRKRKMNQIARYDLSVRIPGGRGRGGFTDFINQCPSMVSFLARRGSVLVGRTLCEMRCSCKKVPQGATRHITRGDGKSVRADRPSAGLPPSINTTKVERPMVCDVSPD